MTHGDPARWLDEGSGLPEGVRDALRRAGEEGPSAVQIARLIAHFGAAGATPSGGGSALRAAATPAGALLLGAGALIVLAGLALRAHPTAGPAQAPHAPSSPPLERAVELPAKSSSSEIPAAAAAPRVAPAPATAARVQPRPSDRTSDVQVELALLAAARRALPGDAAQARASLREHARRFPNGAFVEEREALLVEVSARLGRLGEASTRARAFRARFPHSAYLRRIDSVLEGVR